MNAEQLAAILNGRQYGDEITKQECELARQHGLVVVFGYSDDNVEFRGAINDEHGAYNSAVICIVNGKAIPESEIVEDEEVLQKYGFDLSSLTSFKVEVIWNPEGLDASWLIKVDGGVEFDVLEDDDLFCRGVVFSLPEPKGVAL